MLENKYKFLLDILSYSPLATAIYDSPSLNIAFVNYEMINMWAAEENIVGKSFSAVFPSFKEEGFSEILENVWKTGISYRATDTPADIIRNGIKDRRFFDFEYKALLNDENKTYAIIHTSIDVTERNMALKKVRSQEQQLSYNNELELITHTLAHDAKNPISIAKIAIEALKNNIKNDPVIINKWLSIIDEAIISLNLIIDKTTLLSEARTYKISKKIIPIEPKINSWFKEAKLLNNSPHSKLLTGNILPIYADLSGVIQIFTNLIGNAVKYSSNQENPEIFVDSFQSPNGIEYIIRDNGIGIAHSEIEDIFLNMRRGSNSKNYQGHGMGLFIVKCILERLNGRIKISSKLDIGTEVHLFFPNN